ncbi:hypothetical protein [Umezawaea sp. Da 62-37]|uniref:hypothetical protein n=1 Tax=Umezawaea sp. Da 62-37 TaxID=3075927 RepID=UPI0028F742CE|nr:hypothetical protein [Umezawaea sp. Da 62-37]WNV90678.1 hypothetical protein RM788_21060 [Umezawaea sp. Da 62-37]
MALLFALVGAFALVAPASAAAGPDVRPVVHVHAQQTETVDPTNTGPDLNPPQENRSIGADTKRKLWIGGIAILLFALVYWRNKRRYNKWRKARKAAAG